VSTRISNRRFAAARRNERDTRSSSTNSTMRGSGDHHRTGCPSLYPWENGVAVGIQQSPRRQIAVRRRASHQARRARVRSAKAGASPRSQGSPYHFDVGRCRNKAASCRRRL
jgi:hypothetical protein